MLGIKNSSFFLQQQWRRKGSLMSSICSKMTLKPTSICILIWKTIKSISTHVGHFQLSNICTLILFYLLLPFLFHSEWLPLVVASAQSAKYGWINGKFWEISPLDSLQFLFFTCFTFSDILRRLVIRRISYRSYFWLNAYDIQAGGLCRCK